MLCPFNSAAPQLTAASPALSYWFQDVRWHWLTAQSAQPQQFLTLQEGEWLRRENASTLECHPPAHCPSWPCLSLSVWVQLACLDKTCWLYPGCSAVVGRACAREWLGVCLRSGVSAGQVEQVEWLAGTAERGCRAPPAGLATSLQAGNRKCFITYMEIIALKKFGIVVRVAQA